MPAGPPFPASKGTGSTARPGSTSSNITAETSIFLAGILTSDPELRRNTSGTAWATFRVAVSGRLHDGGSSSPTLAASCWAEQLATGHQDG
jgi:hypothetical protein